MIRAMNFKGYESGAMVGFFDLGYAGLTIKGCRLMKSDSRTMNPTLDQRLIDRALAEDPDAARAEWLAEWRSDIESYVSREVVEACVVPGRFELPYHPKHSYRAFCDPSGGSQDSMTLAVAHSEGEILVLDCLREVSPPFQPDAVCREFAAILKSYRLGSVTGDRYGGIWPASRFEAHGIRYEVGEKAKSDLYRELLPLLNAGRCELLANERLVNQVVGLERRVARSGKDSIDHGPHGHDDLVNVMAGVFFGLSHRTGSVFPELREDTIHV